ncbi:hypothetical protein PsorP6_001499 [Peronosclerospora sorghi]|uniref:Uncharacterized protein n=1 Tax=Peronosclerospora sorghi TaxID=230839 RepID=A0ACC0WR83_9STRA|nr:hypothetical protein PsorP6_001499 [Peronosclerospora sorghi]
MLDIQQWAKAVIRTQLKKVVKTSNTSIVKEDSCHHYPIDHFPAMRTQHVLLLATATTLFSSDATATTHLKSSQDQSGHETRETDGDGEERGFPGKNSLLSFLKGTKSADLPKSGDSPTGSESFQQLVKRLRAEVHSAPPVPLPHQKYYNAKYGQIFEHYSSGKKVDDLLGKKHFHKWRSGIASMTGTYLGKGGVKAQNMADFLRSTYKNDVDIVKIIQGADRSDGVANTVANELQTKLMMQWKKSGKVPAEVKTKYNNFYRRYKEFRKEQKGKTSS